MLTYKNSYLYIRTNALVRRILLDTLGRLGVYVILNEYPKSGATWLGQMLSKTLGLPFPRNKFPLLTSSIMHGHYLALKGRKNVVIVWRDGRDVMVSWYHHCLFLNERSNALLVRQTREQFHSANYADVRSNLPRFLEYAFTVQRHPGFTWAHFVNQWYGRKGAVFVRYEDLRRDPANELVRIISGLGMTGKTPTHEQLRTIVEYYSFERQSGRQAGQESKSSFMRKGIVGDWVNYFDSEARTIFDSYAGNELIKLGYEPDHRWAQ